MTFSFMAEHCYAECHIYALYAEGRGNMQNAVNSIVMLNVIRLSVVAPYLDLKLSLCLTSFQISKDNNDRVVAIDIIQK